MQMHIIAKTKIKGEKNYWICNEFWKSVHENKTKQNNNKKSIRLEAKSLVEKLKTLAWKLVRVYVDAHKYRMNLHVFFLFVVALLVSMHAIKIKTFDDIYT